MNEFINYFKIFKITDINMSTDIKKTYYILCCKTHSDKFKNINVITDQQNLNAVKNTLLDSQNHIKYIMKFDKKLHKYFDCQDLCIQLLKKDEK